MNNKNYNNSVEKPLNYNSNIANYSLRPIGVDYGNEILKVKTASNEFGIANLIAPGRTRRKLTADKAHPINLLDVEIQSNGKNLGRWFVGGMAYKYSHSRLLNREEGGNKADYPYLLHSVLTAIAYAIYDPELPQKKVEVVLGTGLSAEEYWQYQNHHQLLRSKLIGHHTVKFMNQVFKGAEVALVIKDVIITPESSAAALAYITGDDGNINSNALNEIRQSFNLIVDIGGFTTDIAVLYDGDFEDSFGFDSGIAEPMNLISEALLRDYGIDITRQQVGIAIRKNNGVIRTRQGDTVDINEITENYLWEFTVQIIGRLFKALRVNDIKKKQINKAYFVGGGALVLRKYLKRYITDLDIDVLDDPLMANVRGYYISARDKNYKSPEHENNYDADDVYMS